MANKTKQKQIKPIPRKAVNIPKKTEKNNQKKNWYRNILIIASILIVTYISVSPSLKNGFTNWDDNGYVTENSAVWHLRSENIKIFFTDFFMSIYHPLTMLSLAIDYNSVKLDPARYHLINVLFHVLNTLLVFIFIYRLSGKKIVVAAIVALLFGIHPMHVESVAWISGRKDVLYTFFFIGALITYLSYLRKETRSILFYFSTLVIFVLSLLCKPAAVTLPVIMLLIDFFMKRKFDKKCLLEKIPFFIISIIFGIISIKAQVTGGSVSEWSTIDIQYRLMFASYGFIAYIYKLFIPFNLSSFYPYPTKFPITEAVPVIFYAAPFIALGLFFLVYKSLKISRVYTFGFLFYFFNIVLVLQFLSVGAALMADRYSYVSYIGLAFIAGTEFDRLYNNKKKSANAIKYAVTGLLIIYGIMFAYLTYQRTQIWKDNNTLWSDVIEKYPGKVETAYKNRGNYFARELKQYDKALQDYNTLISLNSHDASILNNRGNLYVLMQKPRLSIADYTKAIAIDSNYCDSYINRGITYVNMGIYDSALADMNKAIKLNPQKPEGYKNRAFCYLSTRKYEEAIKDYNFLISKDSEDANNYFNRGIAFFNAKKYNESIADFSVTLQLDPDYKTAYINRSQAYNYTGNYKNALNDALKAQQMGQPVNEGYIKTLKLKI